MNWHDLHFLRPYWLMALLPLAVMFVLFLKRRFTQGQWAAVCDEALLPFILDTVAPTQTRWMLGVLTCAGVLSVLALAGPTWERLETPTFSNNAALVIALDLSLTMNATDIKPSRLARARFKIADILRQRKDGLTALVVYSADAFTVTPLTNDTATITNQLSALESSIMPVAGKNTAAALAQSIKLLKQAGQQQGDILLVTDAAKSSDLLETGSYKLSVLGVGTADGGPVKMEQGGFLKDSQGNIVLPRLKAATLSVIAKNGGGIYTTISADDTDVNQLLSYFDRAVSSQIERDNGLVELWNDAGAWLLLLVLPLAVLSFRQGLLMLCLVVILPMPNTSYAVDWDGLWLTKNQQAQQAFNNNQFDKAAEKFESAEWKGASQYKAGNYQQAVEELSATESADGLYNKGNAHAKLGDYENAIEAYQQALKVRPDNDDAKHNLKLVKAAQNEQQKNQNKDQQKNQQKDDKDESQEQNKNNSPEENSSDGEQKKSASGLDEEGEIKKPEESTNKNAESTKDDPIDQSNSSEGVADNEPTEKAVQRPLSDEKKQAAEQWLNRLEGDPAGLLKRKFKYQYGQRRQKK